MVRMGPFLLLLFNLATASWFSSDTFRGAELQSSWTTHRISKRSSQVLEADYSKALDRINQVSKKLDKKLNYAADVDIYVIGAGVSSTHSEVGERYRSGWTFDNTDHGDCDGYGTAAASVAMGETLGIAREASVIPVKVHCKEGVSTKDLKDGVGYIESAMKTQPKHRAVVLVAMHLSSDQLSELKVLAERVVVVIPAGDNGNNAHDNFKSLKDSAGALVVGGSTKEDEVDSRSDYGSAVDIYAPGKDVTIALNTDNTQTSVDSSTIYAAAAVAGVSATQQGDVVEVDTVELQKAMILSKSTKGALKFTKAQEESNSNNRLLFFICSYFKIPDDPKCYIAQSMELLCGSIKSVHMFDATSYEYTEHCGNFTLFASTASDLVISVSHVRLDYAADMTLKEKTSLDQKPSYIIKTGSNIIKLSPGPTITIDETLLTDEKQPLSIGNIYRENAINITHEIVTTGGGSSVPFITVDLTDYGVIVTYDCVNELRVEITDNLRYYNKTSGLCGFYDRSQVIEFMDKNLREMGHISWQKVDEKKSQISKFVEEWKTGDYGECKCSNDCDKFEDCQPIAEKACSSIKDPSGPYNICHEKLPPHEWYERCVEAVAQCCCEAGDEAARLTQTEKCKCDEEKKYWTAALWDNCVLEPPCEDDTCPKNETHELCKDNAGTKTEFFYQDVIKYDPIDKCHYVIPEEAGSKETFSKTHCKADGTWSKEPAVCDVKTCVMPVAGINAILQQNKDSYSCPEKVTFKCTKTECDCGCYKMDSSDELTCVSAGDRIADWNTKPPTCSLKHCDQPVAPHVDIPITTEAGPFSWVQEIVDDNVNTECCAGKIHYKCHECYQLNSPAEAQCCAKTSLGWGKVPTCQLQKCVDPQLEIAAGDDPHLVVTTTDFYCGTEAEYSCNNACYEIDSTMNKTRRCGADGWDGALPKCVRKSCPELPSFDNGVYFWKKGDSANPLCGDIVTTDCKDCHFPCAGGCERQCVADGDVVAWNGTEPVCQIRQCGPRPAKHTLPAVYSGKTDCGGEEEVKCDKCYEKKSGDEFRKCDVDPNDPMDQCPYKTTDGVWTGEPLVCELQECPERKVEWPLIEVRTWDCKDTKTNNNSCGCKKTYTCDPCYTMNGDETVTCDGDTWDKPLPTCELKTCPWPKPDVSRNFIPLEPRGCYFKRDGKEVYSNDTFTCGEHLTVEAKWTECYHGCHNVTFHCENTGNWNVSSNSYPSCVLVKCDQPGQGTNTIHKEKLDKDERTCNKTVNYECKKCHKYKSGDMTRWCNATDVIKSADGKWNGSAPVCEKMTCEEKDIVDPRDGRILTKNLECGQEVEYECNECKRMVGEKTQRCEQINGTDSNWNNDPPKCQPICCPTLSNISSTDSSYDVIATSLTYVKDKAFVPDDMEVQQYKDNCELDHVCQEMKAKCDECFEYTDGDAVDGAPPNRVCKKNDDERTGYWTNTDKTCKRKTCDLRKTIPSINYASYIVDGMRTMNECNNTVKIKCDRCYKLPEAAVVNDKLTVTQTCQSNKEWSDDLPKCEILVCDPLEDIEFGTVSSKTSTLCDEEVEYTCDRCNRLVGNRTRRCVPDKEDPSKGVWSDEAPRCEPICCDPLPELQINDATMTPSTLISYTKPNITDISTDAQNDDVAETCKRDYVCQRVDAECNTCFEYTQDDAVFDQPPSRECLKSYDDASVLRWKGQWTNEDKYCTLKKCQYREITADRNIHYLTKVEEGSATPCNYTVTLECDDCTELNSSDHRVTETHQCLDTKEWSTPEIPKCYCKQCPVPDPLDHCKYVDIDVNNKCGPGHCQGQKELKCEECYYDESCKLKEAEYKESMRTTCKNDSQWHWNVEEPEINIKKCPDIDPDSFKNGSVNVENTDCNGLAKYTCDTCFKFEHPGACLCETRKCISDPADCTKGMWNDTAPVCQRITCPRPNLPDHVKILDSERNDTNCGGNGIKMECEEGHYLVDGDLERTCTESGTWTGKMPECKIKTCNPVFDPPANGQVNDTANHFGAVVHFTCNPCYEMPDEFTNEDFMDKNTTYPVHDYLKCEATGNWNGSQPACRKKSCGNPGSLSNMQLLGSDFTCRSEVKYQCNTGYERASGSLVRKCSENADGSVSWKGEPPVCSPVDCGEVVVTTPLNVDYDGHTTYTYKLEYSCGVWPEENCYIQPVPSEAQCLANASWSIPTPASKDCQRLSCPSLEGKVKNGTMHRTKPNRPYNDCRQRVYWTCDNGYSSTHDNYAYCDGIKWNIDVPECQKDKCQVQEAPDHGTVNPSSENQTAHGLHFLDQKLTYHCDNCYTLDGTHQRHCVYNPEWRVTAFNGTAPTCKKKMCKSLNFNLDTGRIDTHSTDCGTTVIFSCARGYELKGNNYTKCQDDGSLDSPNWSHKEPTCEEIECPKEGIVIADAEIQSNPPEAFEKKRYPPWTTISYRCHEGYKRIGAEEIMCGSDGTWDLDPPICEQVPCKDLEEPEHGRFVVETSKRVVVQCDPCYNPVDEARTTLHCVNGTWDNRPTKCRQTYCGHPGSPSNGGIKDDQYSTLPDYYKCNMEIEYECDQGYSINAGAGDEIRRCTESGAWTGQVPTCVIETCPPLLHVEHSILLPTSNNATKVSYTCEEGYKLNGEKSVRKCFQGQWTGTPVTCILETCGKWGTLQFGTITPIAPGLEGGDRTYGAAIKYSCNDDDRYQLEGDDVRNCTKNGWSGRHPSCVCTKCPALSVEHGKIETQGENRVTSKIQYVCDKGYEIAAGGDYERECLKNGSWTGTDSTCIPMTCPRPAEPEGGKIITPNPDQKEMGQTVSVECDLNGQLKVLTCQANMTWLGEPVKCNCHMGEVTIKKTVKTVTPGVCFLGSCQPDVVSEKTIYVKEWQEVCA